MADSTPNLPNPQSYDQILSDMLSAYATKLGIDDNNVGSINTSFFEVVALMVARSSGDLFQILRDFSLSRATGDALQRLAAEENITPKTAQPTTGTVNVIDTSFTKISTKVYAGSLPPNIGSTQINVSNAAAFPGTGSIYIGRGTPNVEGPLPYTSITPVGGYYVINLSVSTTKFHNLGETVILAQGGSRSIPINTIVLSPGTGSNSDLQYSTTASAVILDGETEVDGVPVTALIPGSSGNIPIGAIKSFATPPFSGATVTNTLPFTTGQDNETDDELRVRVQLALASTGLGTATAVLSALIGAQAPDQPETIVSDSIQINTDGSATVFVDNGSGYEATSTGVGLEAIVDSAIGGEQFFSLQTGGSQAPVAKAFLQSNLSAPFDLIGGDTLAVIVGETTYQHVFSNSDFRSPGGATAYEITASINADNALGFEATTAGGGLYVVIRPKSENTNSIRVTTPTTPGRNAAVQLEFSANTIETLRLYKNNVPLSEDGSTASVLTQEQTLWSTSISNGDTIIVSIDGTSALTFTILNSDFIETGLYNSVASTNSLESWVQVFNNKLTGITASIVGTQIELTSNLGVSSRAKLVIDPSSTLVSKGMFGGTEVLSSSGANSDYTLDRNTAQFELAAPLIKGDKLSAGTTQTEATLTTDAVAGGSITFASDAHIWMLIDSPGTIINTGVTSNTILSVSKPSTNVVRYTSNVSGAFGNVLPGDYLIIWSNELDPADRLEGRVHAVTSTTLDVLITAAEYAAIVTTAGVFFQSGFVVIRTSNVPQKFKIGAGTKTLDQIVVELQSQTESVDFSVLQGQFVVANTVTLDNTGSLLVVTADSQGQLLLMPINKFATSTDSLIAFYDSGDRDAQLPLFLHSTFSADAFANPIDSYIASAVSSISLSGQDPNDLIGFLQPYGSQTDAQPYGEYVQETSVSGSTIGLALQPNLRRIRGGVDRFYLASPLNFGHNDTVVTVLDNNTGSESFTIPLYRDALTNTTYTTNPTNFNAYDVTSGPTTQFASFFGANFDFSNFKVLMQAKKVLKPSPSQTAILYRSATWGSSGENIRVGYTYPSAPNLSVSSSVVVSDIVSININLQSGNPISSSIDLSTQWNITVTANTPSAGIDQVTYTWSGVGTAPALALSGGEYVNITTQTAFNVANTGIFRVSTQGGFTPTATSFSVQRPTGVAVPQSNVSTQVNGAISFYASSATTALVIKNYVNANLSQYVSGTLVNDGGSSGSGVIALSTYEDSGFTYSSVALLDGINWIMSSNLGGSPQFVLKSALSLPTDVGYAFNNGEDVRLVPTTMDQVRRFISVLAVSGFTTLGTVNVVDRASRLDLATQVLGSLGAVQIVGGTGNEYQVPVLDSAGRLNNTYMSVSADSVASAAMESDQWFRLQGGVAQKKISGFSSNTSITVTPNVPTTGQATISLFGKTLTQRYFGLPRMNIATRGDTFKVEKQGTLVCVSWNGIGTNPNFFGDLNFNDTGGGTFNASLVSGTNDVQYTVLTGNANFTELSIGDLIAISGLPISSNNGTFPVTGVSDDGKTVQVTNPNAQNEFSKGTFTFNTNAAGGDTFTVGATTLTAGTYASFTGTVAGMSTNVTITANNFGTIGNSVTLSFDGATTVSTAIAAWNVANPLNQITLTSGNGSQVPNNSTSISLSGGMNGNFAIGATAAITAANLSATIGTLPQVTSSVLSNVVTVTGTFTGQVLALAYAGSHVTVSGSFIVGDSFVAGNFSASSGVQEGDTVLMKAPFNILNQGRFRVIRQYNNSFWIENPDVVEEEVTLPYNPVNLGFDATTSFAVSVVNNKLYLNWNGTGTEPFLGNAVMGDIVTLGTDFASANQGNFTVASAGVKLNQIAQFTLPTGSQFVLGGAGKYFEIANTANVNKYYVWFNVNSSNSDPGPIIGFTGVEVDILSGDNAATVAAKTALAINGHTTGITATSIGTVLTTALTGFAATMDPVNVNVPAPFSVNVIQEGRTTFLEAINPAVTAQSPVFVSGGVLQAHRPQMQFTAYDGTVPGDNFVVSGNVLALANVGSYSVVEVLDTNTAIVSGNMTAITNASLNGNETAVFVQEGVLYSGYKKVFSASAQPGAPTRNLILFDTNAQYEKVNQAASVQMVSLGKLNFNTALKNGLDGYRYNTGLIGEANRIIYGDPRNPSTYPGVGAAGAQIFVREPLALRIQVAIDIRLLTGAPFANVAQQVQSAVASLIRSNPVGQSIDVSSIVAAARAVPGVISVAVSSPQYDATHDLIALQPSQKAIIVDPGTDVIVSQIGS